VRTQAQSDASDHWARGYYVKDSPREKERLLFAAP
jgi:hypothetical protein